MTTCPVCHSTDIQRFSGAWLALEVCCGCGRTLSAQTRYLGDAIRDYIQPLLPSADEMVAVAEAIMRGKT